MLAVRHCRRNDMYLFAAAACLAAWCYEKLVVNAGGIFPNALLAAAFLVTALHLAKTAEAA